MQRRKFVIGLGALTAGGAAAAGTGAFTNTTADRDIEVAVADDASAFLRLEAMDDSPNADAFVEEEDDTIAIDITETEDDDNTLGEGLNPNAETKIEDLFHIQNQGTQEIEVYIDETFEPITVEVLDTSEGSEESDDLIIDNEDGKKQELGVGEEADVGLVLDTSEYEDGAELDTEFTIKAEATDNS